MEKHNKIIGAYGENLAVKYLISKGAEILAKNYQTSLGEIDIIAKNRQEILFIEVKTRTSSTCGYPEIAVNREKRERIFKIANHFLQKNRLSLFWRLDIIAIEINKSEKTAKIRWFKDIT